MTSTFGPAPVSADWITRELSAGAALGFYIVDDDGSRSLSHTIESHRGRYHVHGMSGEPLGRFVTFKRASFAGFSASALALDHGL